MNLLPLALLSLTLGYAVFQRAGVALNDWNTCLVATGVVAVIHFLVPRRERIPKLDRVVAISAAVFIGIAALQLVPLPVALVRALSPARVELLQAVNGIGGEVPRFVTLTTVPYETAEYLLTLAGYAAVLLLLRDFTLRGSRRSWPAVWPLLIIGGIEAILGLYQASASPNAFATGTYASRDHYAGLLEMIFPFAVTYPLAILQREERQFTSPLLRTLAACGLLGLAIVLLAAIIQSLCRMAFLASLAALFVVAMLTLASRRSSGDSKGPSGWRKLRPAATVAAVLLLGFLVLQTDAMMGRFTELASSDKVSADARGEIWRNTVDLIKAFPLFGCGLGGYQSGLLRFQTVAPLKTVNYAHNDYLQVQAEMGIVGLLVGLLFVGRLLQQTVAGVRKAPSVEERYLAIACAASMTAMLLHSLVDFNMYVPANGMVFAWVAGIACTYARPRIPARPED